MLIIVNNQSVDLTADTPTLGNLLQQLQFGDKKGFAIAIQDQIVPKSTWPTYTLQENDKVTIIQATQGG
ncbi:sulfur carrier protein ThiS [Adhaeribacter aquaticus]|uniref:sulfur carrier protein ThiS n=1 Tax=Adhaeribacter aquaticus TaxID=299567 RepID=UPI0004184C36|nr:sulfur carrier protein ThiS [Adhaeribacter aquaticus]